MKILVKSNFLLIKVDIVGVDLDKINLDDDNNSDKNNPETIIYVRHLTWPNKFEKCKALQKDISK